MLGAASYRDAKGNVPLEMFVPVVGPWMTVFRQDRLDGNTLVSVRFWNATIRKIDWDDCHGAVALGCVMAAGLVGATVIGEAVLLVLDPAIQGGGLIAAALGGPSDERARDRAKAPTRLAPKVSFRPAPVVGPVSTGLGATLAITSW